MGLSDEERISKATFAVRGLTEEANEKLTEDRFGDYKRLVDLINQLWPAFRGGLGNSGYWFAGGDFATDSLSGKTLTSIAFQLHTGDRDEIAEARRSEDPVQHRPSIESLLRRDDHHGRHRAAVYSIYCWTEAYFYAANRYSDELSKQLSPVSAIVAKIQGECFDHFVKQEEYARAYFLAHVLERVWPWTPAEKVPFIASLWIDSCLWHHVKLDNVTQREAFELFKEMQVSRWGSQRCLEISAKVAGGKICGHKREGEKLRKNAVDWNEGHPNDLIDLARLDELIATSIAARTEKHQFYQSEYECPFDTVTMQHVTRGQVFEKPVFKEEDDNEPA